MAGKDTENLLGRIAELERELAELRVEAERSISESLTRYKRIIDATSEGFVELDLDYRVVDANDAIAERLGVDRQDLIGRRFDTIYDRDSVFVHFASPDHLSFEADFAGAGGGSVSLLCKRSILRDQERQASGHLIFLTDLTELKQARKDLQRAETRYREMYKNAAQGMYQVTLDGRFVRVNPALAHTFGFASTHELMNSPGGVRNLYKNPEERHALVELLKREKVIRNHEIEMVRCDGRPVWALVSARLAEDSRGRTLIEGILIDNTEKRIAEEKLRVSRERFRYLANHDNLTNLYNTRYLYKALDRLITASQESGRPFSLVFLDMDNFKRVVDTYGHLNGSQALKEVAGTLERSLVEPAFGVAYGGDEFVLVLPDTSKAGALTQIGRIRRRMKGTVYLENKGLSVRMSASFGIATYPDDAVDREGLLALADEAMFRVKTHGKDAVGTIAAAEERQQARQEGEAAADSPIA